MIPIKIETLLEGRKIERDRIEYKEGFNPSDIVHTVCAYAMVDVYSKKESGKMQDKTMKYWIRPASLTTEGKRSELAELFEKFSSIPFVDRVNMRISMDQIRRGYLEDFIRAINSTLVEELNIRSFIKIFVWNFK